MWRPKQVSKIYVCLLVVLLSGLVAAMSGQEPQTSPSPPTQVKEELLGEKDALTPAKDDEDTASPDGRRVAWIATRGQKRVVVVNGQQHGTEFDKVRWVLFSGDSQHLLYEGKRDNKWLMVVDGKEGATYDDITSPYLSPDGQRVVYAAKRHKKWVMVVDGKEDEHEWDDILTVAVSPDARRFAYVARRGGNYIVVVDGKEGPKCDIVGGLTFSRDSRRIAYAAARVKVTFGGQKTEGFVVVDGQQGPVFEGRVGGLGKALTGTREELVEGYFDSLWPAWHGVSSPVFSPDGTHVAYAARRDKNEMVATLDGEPGPKFEAILSAPVFSPDSQHVAYVALENGKVGLVLDTSKVTAVARKGAFLGGLNSEVRPGEFANRPTFSPDSRRVAYVWVRGGSWYGKGLTRRARRQVFLDGQPGKEYDAVGLSDLTFSPDSQHFAYETHDIGNDVSLVVVDGQEGKHYDAVMPDSISVTDQKTVTYVAREGRKFYRVTQPVP